MLLSTYANVRDYVLSRSILALTGAIVCIVYVLGQLFFQLALSNSARIFFFSMFFSFFGFSLLAFIIIHDYVLSHGLISLIPNSLKRYLFDLSIIDVLHKETQIRTLFTDLLFALFVEFNEAELERILQRLPPSIKTLLTQRGLLRLSPYSIQRYFLPGGAFVSRANNQEKNLKNDLCLPVLASEGVSSDGSKGQSVNSNTTNDKMFKTHRECNKSFEVEATDLILNEHQASSSSLDFSEDKNKSQKLNEFQDSFQSPNITFNQSVVDQRTNSEFSSADVLNSEQTQFALSSKSINKKIKQNSENTLTSPSNVSLKNAAASISFDTQPSHFDVSRNSQTSLKHFFSSHSSSSSSSSRRHHHSHLSDEPRDLLSLIFNKRVSSALDKLFQNYFTNSFAHLSDNKIRLLIVVTGGSTLMFVKRSLLLRQLAIRCLLIALFCFSMLQLSRMALTLFARPFTFERRWFQKIYKLFLQIYSNLIHKLTIYFQIFENLSSYNFNFSQQQKPHKNEDSSFNTRVINLANRFYNSLIYLKSLIQTLINLIYRLISTQHTQKCIDNSDVKKDHSLQLQINKDEKDVEEKEVHRTLNSPKENSNHYIDVGCIKSTSNILECDTHVSNCSCSKSKIPKRYIILSSIRRFVAAVFLPATMKVDICFP